MELSLGRSLSIRSRTAIRSTSAEAGTSPSTLWVLAAALASLLCKLAIAYDTFGTNDVNLFYMFARSLNQHGLTWTYSHAAALLPNLPLFNHPPLIAYYLELIDAASRQEFFRACGLTFPFLLRLPGVVADFVVVLVLLQLRKVGIRIPTWALILFALSPVSLMVSGFHGNTDPLLVMFLVLAMMSCLRGQPLMCAFFLALSCQIKIIPLLFLPTFLLFWRKQDRTMFTMFFLLVTIGLCLQPLLQCPALFFSSVFGYGSYWGTWGITYLLRLTQWTQFNGTGAFHLPPAAAAVVLALKCLIVALTLMLAWRRRFLREKATVESMAYIWIIFFVLSPGVAPQYMVWLAPFVLIVSRLFYLCLLVTSSMFLFVFYNTTAGGLPWYHTNSTNIAEIVDRWTPWSLCAWLTLAIALVAFCNRAFSAHPAGPLLGSNAIRTVNS